MYYNTYITPAPTLHRNIHEAVLVPVSHLGPGRGHLTGGGAGSAVEVHDEGDHDGVGGVVPGRQVQEEAPGYLALPGV